MDITTLATIYTQLQSNILMDTKDTIYITQLIFVKEGKEKTFLEFEKFAIPLMEKYKGRIIYRLRPTKETFISEEKELPYEIHFISFDSEKDFNEFMKDDSRLDFIHLKEESVSSMMLVKGQEIYGDENGD